MALDIWSHFWNKRIMFAQKFQTIKTTIMVMLNNRTYRIMTFLHRKILYTKQRAYIRSRRYHANTTNVKMHTPNTRNNFCQQKLYHFFATTKKWQWKRWKIDQNIPPSALTKNPIFFSRAPLVSDRFSSDKITSNLYHSSLYLVVLTLSQFYAPP